MGTQICEVLLNIVIEIIVYYENINVIVLKKYNAYLQLLRSKFSFWCQFSLK